MKLIYYYPAHVRRYRLQLSRAMCLNSRALRPQEAGHRARFPVHLQTVNLASHRPDRCEIAPALPVEGQLAG